MFENETCGLEFHVRPPVCCINEHTTEATRSPLLLLPLQTPQLDFNPTKLELDPGTLNLVAATAFKPSSPCPPSAAVRQPPPHFLFPNVI